MALMVWEKMRRSCPQPDHSGFLNLRGCVSQDDEMTVGHYFELVVRSTLRSRLSRPVNTPPTNTYI